MEKQLKARLENTSKMLLHWVQEVRRTVKKEDEADALRCAREALDVATWVITYAEAIKTLKYERKEQK